MLVNLETEVSLQIYEGSDSLPVTENDTVTKLPGVGFHPWMEMSALRQDLLKSSSSEDRKKILEQWLVKARKNLIGYWQEYIDQRLVLPIGLEIAEIDGQKRVTSSGVENAVWVDAIGSWERNGSVKESAIKIEEFLVNAPPLSAAVLVSPGGDEYPDTQTYIFWIDSDGNLDSMTIRTDPNIDDNESFLFNTKPDFNPDTKASLNSRVETVIRNPLLLAAENGYGFSPESIIKAIQVTKSCQEAFKNKGFEKLFNDFNNRNQLSGARKLVEAVVEEFANFCIQSVADTEYNPNKKTYKLVEDKLGETVLKLSYIKRHLQALNINFGVAISRLNNLNPYDYREELRYLQTISGCAGGGLSKNYTDNGFGIRELKQNISEAKIGPICFCSTCGGSVKTYVIEGEVYCSLCGDYLGKL